MGVLLVCAARWTVASAADVLTRDRLVGVWRLVGIEYSGADGSRMDPFYQAQSSGLLIYDASGWMSVRISAPDRVSFEVPDRRPGSREDASLREAELAALDTYYTYDGTWEFDPKTSELTHRVVSSLLPAESGKTYTQRATLENGRLIFTNRSGQAVRRKVWERVASH